MGTAAQLQHSSSLRSWLPNLDRDRIRIGDVLVDNCSFEQAASAIVSYAVAGGPPAYVVTPNAQHIVLVENDARLREIYERADLIVADGISLVLAARVFGRELHERVAGVDLFERLCELAAESGLRVFFLGGRPGSADLTAAKLLEQYPNLKVTTYCPPMRFEHSPDELRRTAEIVERARPDLLFVGFGAPKQEFWIYEHGLRLGAAVSIGVGGTFELVAGVVPRAPKWVQNIGTEWLYRLCMEPRRLWRRYLIGNAQFCGLVLQQGWRRALVSAVLSILREEKFAEELKEPSLRRKAEEFVTSVGKRQPMTSKETRAMIAGGNLQS
jgi:N-acetylglucosaminyldiphosphoundecaprenol N-acetyl-beta-D-mannosaminyltransferase